MARCLCKWKHKEISNHIAEWQGHIYVIVTIFSPKYTIYSNYCSPSDHIVVHTTVIIQPRISHHRHYSQLAGHAPHCPGRGHAGTTSDVVGDLLKLDVIWRLAGAAQLNRDLVCNTCEEEGGGNRNEEEGQE